MSSAGLLLCEPHGTLLFCHRTADGWWATPGGGVELGESPRAGALRELWEETRIRSVSDMRVLMVSQSFTLFGAYVATKLVPRLDHEHDTFAWLPSHDPPRDLHPGLRGLWRDYPRDPRPHRTVASFVANRGASEPNGPQFC